MIDQSPYAQLIGARRNIIDGEPALTIRWHTEIQGRLGFFHGGVIGGLLEMACYEAVQREFTDAILPRVKPVNVAVDYLRGGVMMDMHAFAQIVRIGKRVANASAICWQDDRTKPIATARMHLLVGR